MNTAQDDLPGMRTDYLRGELPDDNLPDNPLTLFEQWFNNAHAKGVAEPNACVLATASAEGCLPDARVLLLKDIIGGGLVFYTNYTSRKGMQLAENPHAAMVFFWQPLEQQVRIRGIVSKVPPAQSDEYFYSRPLGSRVSAAASPQSKIVPNRAFLENQVALAEKNSGPDGPARPPEWGGYILQPDRVEFWQGRKSRLHDRIEYRLLDNGVWVKERLAP